VPDDYARRSARVILVDGTGRTLLFHSGGWWFTPGGGVEPGETDAVAAARELAEETGVRVEADRLAGPVAIISGWADLGWRAGTFLDVFYFHRVDVVKVDTSGFQALEASVISEIRWWTVEEIEAAPERVVPHGLAGLLRDLLAGRVPVEPVALPWHH
jgi:8-oxo-dGTP pyrophosphatase MutT (NUDIX family)